MRCLRFLSLFLGLSPLFLAGCNTIEHRPEVNPKAALPKVAQKQLAPKIVWTNGESSGNGKKDANLRLSITQQEIYVADYKGKVLALDKETGKRKWVLETKTNIASGPEIINSKVVIGTEEGQVLAYQKEDGAILWKAEVAGPVVAAPAGDSKAIFVHVLNGSVLALQAETGQEIWRYQVNTPPIMLRQSSSPVLFGRDVLVGFSNGKLIAFDKQEGSVTWEREIAISKGRSDLQRMVDVCTDPIVKDNKVYVVSYQGQVSALELATGHPIWEKELSSFSGIAVTPQTVIVSDPKGVVWALSRKTGDVLWQQAGLAGRILSQPTVMQNYIVVGDDDGYLHWLSQNDGSFVGQMSFGGKGITAAPLVKDDVLYVLGRNGKVGAIKINPILDTKQGN